MAPTFFKALCVVVLPSNHLKSPLVLFTTFKTMPNVVDFPLPLGPKIPYTLPLFMVNDNLLTAVKYPNFLVRLLLVSIGSKVKVFMQNNASVFGWLLKYDDSRFILLQIHYFFLFELICQLLIINCKLTIKP